MIFRVPAIATARYSCLKGVPVDITALRELKAMLDEGLISQEEFDARKAEILNAGAVAAAAEIAAQNQAQAPVSAPKAPKVKVRKTAAILAVAVLGMFGVHKFYMGKTRSAVITLCITILLGITLVAPACMLCIGIIEGVTYFNMTDEEWTETYINGKKEWF